MRILHVNKYLYRRGGAEGYMLDVSEMQQQRGHQVELFGMQHPENDLDYGLDDTFPSYIELEPPPGGTAALGAAARMIWSRECRAGLAQAISRFRPDVLHCHNIYHQLSPSILRAAAQAGVPVVMTLHDYKLACPSYQMLDHGKVCDACVGGSTLPAIRRRCKSGSLPGSALLAIESGIHRATNAYRDVDAFISPSRFLATVMERQGIAAERLHVVPHFVHTAGIPQNTGSGHGVVFGGRLAHEKGVDTLIQAATLAPEVPVHIAGDGPERQRLEAMAAAHPEARITFHGRLSRAQLLDLVATSAAMVVPSRWNENQPMTILEAYAAATPVIATSLGGMPELVRDHEDGLIVPPDDPAALAGAMRTLAGDPAEAHRMGTAGQATLREVHDPERHLDALETVYARAGAHVPTLGGAR